MTTITDYPTEIQEEVKRILTAYPRVWVFKIKDGFRVSTAIGIKASYEDIDYVHGEFRNYDFYTQVEIDQFNSKMPDMNW